MSMYNYILYKYKYKYIYKYIYKFDFVDFKIE